ncbi:MAG: 30S ribosomal protein S24e [Candidatus Thermoplasmatota archaeon]
MKVDSMVEIEIEQEKENKLMHRRELILSADHEGEGTPSRKDLNTEISNLVNASKNEVVIDKVDTEYGKEKSMVHVRVYDDEEYVEEFERDYFQNRT